MKTVILTLLLIIGFSTLGYPCTCFTPNFPLKYLSQNDTLPINRKHFIIKGKVLERIENIYNKSHRGDVFNILVLEYWPNDHTNLNDTLTIIDDELDCAVYFQKDSIYLIGAFSTHRYLGTSACEGTGLISEYKDQIDKLGPGKKPKVSEAGILMPIQTDAEVGSRDVDYSKIIVLLLLTVSLITNVYLLRKK